MLLPTPTTWASYRAISLRVSSLQRLLLPTSACTIINWVKSGMCSQWNFLLVWYDHVVVHEPVSDSQCLLTV